MSLLLEPRQLQQQPAPLEFEYRSADVQYIERLWHPQSLQRAVHDELTHDRTQATQLLSGVVT